ncbi:Ig-like domain-containing protein [Psychrobacillus sp. OK032]|uniref:Ig-like domain-containing protein n=1 Tax=Psychrobacillus sp. OK032 TaxID=1884358 RepID=UPI0008C00514|nr:Ig-like domain-containing protein [Psychrobacillus sp. OK032]SES44680.1 Leucine-rich repeat (LRR) protein [Psychrobacillus sp. OK032]
MKHTILSIFSALFLLSSQSPVYASDLAGNTVIFLEDPLLQEKLESYVDSCDRQNDKKTTIDRISNCLEKNNGSLTLGNWYAGDVRTLKGMEKLAGLPIKQLNIQNTHARGQSITDLTPLSKIKSLESLQLDGTFSNDFSPLATLPNLKELTINSTHSQPLLTISLVKNLQKLQLSGNQITSLAGIERMSQLKSLGIDDVTIADYRELTKAPQLTKLSLKFNGSSRFLQSLSNLESLSLINYNDKPTVIQGDDLNKLTKLKFLHLSRTEVNYDFLNVMPRLEELSISYSLKDTSTLFNAINKPMVHLRNIDLSDNYQLSAIEGAEKLSYLFPSIEKINLRGNEISDLSPLVQTDIPYQHLNDLDIDGNNITEINILGKHANLFPALKTIYAESNYIHSISEMTKLPALQSLFAKYNLIDNSDEKNPKKFIGNPQFQLGTPKPLEMSIGSVYDGPILSKYLIQDEDWIEQINSKNLTITFSNPEVAELTEKGNILAKKQGTTTISYSIKGTNDPYFSHSLLLTVRDKNYKPLNPTIYGEVTLETNKITVSAHDEDKVVVSSKGKVIAEVVPSGILTFTLPSLEGLTELQVWAQSKLGTKSNTITVPIYKTEKPQLPNIDPLTDQNEYITGIADPNTTIHITSERQDQSFREQSQKVNADGTFKVFTGKLPAGYSLVFITKNEQGRESDRLSSTVRDITPPAMPVLDSVTSNSRQISGKTEANAKVSIKKMSRYIGDTFADQNGFFKYSIPAPSPGDIFTAIAEDKHENKSEEARIVATMPIKEDIKPQKPVYWKGLQLKKGQIGLVTITKKINLWKRDGDKLVFERVLNPGEVYRVYRYDSKYGGQYGVGGNLFITNIKGYVKYQTPSKAVLAQVK